MCRDRRDAPVRCPSSPRRLRAASRCRPPRHVDEEGDPPLLMCTYGELVRPVCDDADVSRSPRCPSPSRLGVASRYCSPRQANEEGDPPLLIMSTYGKLVVIVPVSRPMCGDATVRARWRTVSGSWIQRFLKGMNECALKGPMMQRAPCRFLSFQQQQQKREGSCPEKKKEEASVWPCFPGILPPWRSGSCSGNMELECGRMEAGRRRGFRIS